MVEFCFNTGGVACKVQIARWSFVVYSKFSTLPVISLKLVDTRGG